MSEKLTIGDLLRAAERELSMRERVYPRWIDQGKMKAEAAAHEIQAMRQIADVLDLFRRFEAPARELFARKIADLKAIERHPAAEALREAFPDADVTVNDYSVSETESEERPT